jgi:hypothetical protein
MTFNEFLEKCTLCGGNWTAMLMTGIKAVAPTIYEEMPDRSFSFDEVCFIVNHLCYDRPHFRFNISLNGEIIEHTADGKFSYRKATEEEMMMSTAEFYKIYNGYEEGK